jgi:predicted porin
VGLTGNWGTAFYGLWDTPFKTMWGRNYAFFGTSAASFIGLFGSPGYNILGGTQTTPTLLANANTSDAAAFDRRQTNTVAYRTPDFAGLSARAHYVPGEQKGSVTPFGYGAPQSLNPWMWSIAATYDRGPIYAAVPYEQHKDYFATRVFTGVTGATGTGSDDWGVRAIIGMQDVPRRLLLYAPYADLAAAFGADRYAGERHFFAFGHAEGRTITFDGLDYIASYNDLIQAFSANTDAGATHYIGFGAAEGRTTTFDGLQYIAGYGDLITALGANPDAGAAHFIVFGFGEGRARDSFNEVQYLANYADLQAAFGTDTEAATLHYVKTGFYEERTDEILA